MSSFSAYYEYLSSEKSGAEVGEMLDRISTNETHFFREPRQFAFLEQQVFPAWQAQATRVSRSKHIRVWSAGCSTGEEPYSIAMILLDHFPPRTGWQIEILATDLSQRALRAARTAVWPIGKAKQIPPKYLKQFMLRGTGAQAGNMKAGTELTALVRFEQLNLNDSVPPWLEHFDLIFCRNVLIYFDARSRARVIHRLVDSSPARRLPVGRTCRKSDRHDETFAICHAHRLPPRSSHNRRRVSIRNLGKRARKHEHAR